MSYIYRERERDRDWDESRSSPVTIKRYVIPPEDDRGRERDVLYRREDLVSGDRELVVRRSTDREDPIMVQRYEREVDYDSRGGYDYRSERDYYEPRTRESDYEIVHRSEVDRDPGYLYHRRVREYDDDRRFRRELSPSDSVSQATRRRDGQDYSSDDSMVYIRKETREYDDHPHHHRHMAEGALVGVGAAELLRSRRKKDGGEVSSGMGRLGRDVGAGALGAVAVNAASRVKDYYRSKSRHRSHSFDDDRSSRSHHRHHHHSHSHSRRSRSRSHSRSRAKTFAEIGLGAAAIAGAVALARHHSKKDKDGRRSRSRHRRSASVRSKGDPDFEKRSESQRKKHMTGAGLAGAAVAGLVERARSHSRSGRRARSRSHSTLRKALPVVAAGLGTAAATGLYEKHKDKKEETKDESRYRERRRSRSRSRAPSDFYPDPARDSADLIEYGEDPVHGSIPAANYYGRSMTPQGYYSDASDPVASGAAGFGSRHRGRGRSRSRSLGRYNSSSSDSDKSGRRRRRRDRSKPRSRSRGLAEAALAATGAGYAAHKYSQHKDRKKAEQDRDRQKYDGRDPYDEAYSPSSAAPQQIENQYYPNSNFFPPPPGPAPRQAEYATPYNQADYPPPGAVPSSQPYNYPTPPGPEPYAPRPRRADENVSATWNSPPSTAQYTCDGGFREEHRSVQRMANPGCSGLKPYSPSRTPRAEKRRSRTTSKPDQPKSVAFNLSPPGRGRPIDPGYESDDSDSTIDSSNQAGNMAPQERKCNPAVVSMNMNKNPTLIQQSSYPIALILKVEFYPSVEMIH
ncbi:hypothetical protein EYZ11_008181 [Aspergillus tanneri]|uniref:DUF3824 domain-containing protein n=1 Tax=Aspergillus tanneri TaxID=1220188 RepID=A0A4S3JBJ6_9EURO|nr:hypothetical protein EYZ11_008181 [Aspergillus tanneri]